LFAAVQLGETPARRAPGSPARRVTVERVKRRERECEIMIGE
jgi:hypothetical protein